MKTLHAVTAILVLALATSFVCAEPTPTPVDAVVTPTPVPTPVVDVPAPVAYVTAAAPTEVAVTLRGKSELLASAIESRVHAKYPAYCVKATVYTLRNKTRVKLRMLCGGVETVKYLAVPNCCIHSQCNAKPMSCTDLTDQLVTQLFSDQTVQRVVLR